MLRRVKSLNFSVSGESLPAEATKQKWRLKLRPAMSMTLNTPLASSSLTENTDTMPMLRLWRRKALMASVLPRRMRMLSSWGLIPCFSSSVSITSSVPEPCSRMTSGWRHSSCGVISSGIDSLPDCFIMATSSSSRNGSYCRPAEWVMPSTMPRSMSWLSSAFSMSRELPLVSDTSICGNLSVNSASICGSTYCATVYAYVSAAALVEQVHVVFHAVILVEYAAAVFKHEPSGIGEHYLSACAVEESYGVLPFQFVDVFGYCRLAYEQLFSRTCETEVLGHAVECF